MDYTSPFQQWLDSNMKGIAASPDIMLLLAKAFEGGRLYEQEECAKVCDEIAEEADAMTKSKFVTDAGRMLHEGMWGGSSNCAYAIRSRKF